MNKKIVPDLSACKSCAVGCCCYEGTELTAREVRRIIAYNPKVPKPWFRLVEKHEQPDGIHHFSTIVRDGTCVFQGKDNRCKVYKVRPHHCREFPLESGRPAEYYHRLCILFHREWHPKSAMKRRVYLRENI